MKDILESLTEEEEKIIKGIGQGIPEEVEKEINDVLASYDQSISTISPNYDTILQFWANGFAGDRNFVGSFDHSINVEVELVAMENYKITPKFAPILESLLRRHGDIGATCKLTQRLKTILLVIFCFIIGSMREEKVMNIRYAMILNCWFLLKTVEIELGLELILSSII